MKTLNKYLYLIILVMGISQFSYSQCVVNTTPYLSNPAPLLVGGSVATSCNYASEYTTFTSVPATTNFSVTSTINTDFITITRGTVDGTGAGAVIASGTVPLSWTSTTADTYFAHINTNSSCDQNSTCRDITLTNTTPITPMVYNSCTTIQPNISNVADCATNAEVIGIEVVTTGGLSPIDLTEFQFNMNGTTTLSEVSNIYIYYTGTSSGFATTNLFATTISAGGTITLNGNQTLLNGINYFWIAYDMDASATIGNVIDATCTQITTTAPTPTDTPTITTPAGNRIISLCNPSPGGVSGPLKLWLSADQGTSTTTDNAPIVTWIDNTTNGSFTGHNSPTYQNDAANLFNYNPTIDFNNSPYFEGPGIFSTSSVTESAVYIIHKTRSSGSGGGLFCETGGADQRFMTHYPFTDGTVYWHNSNDGAAIGDDWCRYTGATLNNPELTTFDVSQANNTRTINVNGLKVSNAGDQTFLPYTGNNNTFFIGTATEINQTTARWHADALIAEIVVQNGGGNVGLDRKKIESYLAIKYAITLDNSLGGINGDYTSINGSNVWDASASPAYHNNIIGISRDDVELLNQKQSHSTNDTTRIYIDALQALNSANSGSFSVDESYVLMGENQGKMCATVASNAEMPASCGLYSRIEREWKVKKTNFAQTYSNDFTLNACAAPTMVNTLHLRLLVDDDGDFSNGGTQCYFNGDGTGIAISYNNSVITIANISNVHIPNNSTKFITIASINPLTPLPVELLNFNINCQNHTPLLSWSTASEINNDYFTIERSLDGILFDSIGVVDGAGNSVNLLNYSFNDGIRMQNVYYRLKQIDFDGGFTYSPVRAISCSSDHRISIYPNPFSNSFTIDISAGFSDPIEITIVDNMGRLVYSQTIHSESKQIKLSVGNELSQGVYFVKVNFGKEHQVEKLTKLN